MSRKRNVRLLRTIGTCAASFTVMLTAVQLGDSDAGAAPIVVTQAPTAKVMLPKWKRDAVKYRPCIGHRESRNNYRSRNHVAFGKYQFTRQSWDITAKREGLTQLVGKRPDHVKGATQERMYLAAWKHGNGKFYWSAKWGGPNGYACWPGDSKPMKGK